MRTLVLRTIGAREIDSLVPYARSADSTQATLAIHVLEAVRSPRALADLIDLLETEDAGVRRAAHGALQGLARLKLDASG